MTNYKHLLQCLFFLFMRPCINSLESNEIFNKPELPNPVFEKAERFNNYYEIDKDQQTICKISFFKYLDDPSLFDDYKLIFESKHYRSVKSQIEPTISNLSLIELENQKYFFLKSSIQIDTSNLNSNLFYTCCLKKIQSQKQLSKNQFSNVCSILKVVDKKKLESFDYFSYLNLIELSMLTVAFFLTMFFSYFCYKVCKNNQNFKKESKSDVSKFTISASLSDPTNQEIMNNSVFKSRLYNILSSSSKEEVVFDRCQIENNENPPTYDDFINKQEEVIFHVKY